MMIIPTNILYLEGTEMTHIKRMLIRSWSVLEFNHF